MPFTRLDSRSEKVLKLFFKHELLSVSQLSVLCSFDASNYLSILIRNKYIENADIGKSNDPRVYMDGAYRITMNGKIYFDLKKQFFIEAVSKSIIAPIIVAFITTLITLLVKGLW